MKVAGDMLRSVVRKTCMKGEEEGGGRRKEGGGTAASS